MNIKRIFGALLTVLGIVGLIYAAVLFVNNSSGVRDIKSLITYGALGLIFFIAGIGLVRTTKDESST
jgi:predicted Na+-dependent transporter